jgi:hypothetical protein
MTSLDCMADAQGRSPRSTSSRQSRQCAPAMILDDMQFLIELTPNVAVPFRVRRDAQAKACGYRKITRYESIQRAHALNENQPE